MKHCQETFIGSLYDRAEAKLEDAGSDTSRHSRLRLLWLARQACMPFRTKHPQDSTLMVPPFWWTAMLLTSIGSEYWPKTPEGRVLCFLLSLYGFAVFGYVTAALASFFIGRDAESGETELVSATPIKELRAEIAALHEELRELRTKRVKPE